MIDVLVTGAGGQLGSVVLSQLLDDGQKAVGLVRPGGTRPDRGDTVAVDLCDREAMCRTVSDLRPAAIFHAAAVSRPEAAFRDPDRAQRVNVDATANLVHLATRASARLLVVSTDLVFDGRRGWYREADDVAPLSFYGRTKVEAERAALIHADVLVVRLPLLFGSTCSASTPGFIDSVVAELGRERPVELFDDEFRTPTCFEAASRASLRALAGGCRGLLHVAGPERVSRYELGLRIAAVLGADPALVRPVSRETASSLEPRPADTSLDTSLFRQSLGVDAGLSLSAALASVG